MTLPCSPNSIAASQINAEFFDGAPVALSEYRGRAYDGGSLPSGQIAYSDFRCKSSLYTIDVLLVGGGGGGGGGGSDNGAGGGGGAGGVLITSHTVANNSSSIAVVVGAGGNGVSGADGILPSGNSSFLSGFAGSGVYGGGGGRRDNRTGGAGGSGGGAGAKQTNVADASGGSGTAGQGNNGGISRSSANNGCSAGGGGGRAEAGRNGDSAGGGLGGKGVVVGADLYPEYPQFTVTGLNFMPNGTGGITYLGGGGGGAARGGGRSSAIGWPWSVDPSEHSGGDAIGAGGDPNGASNTGGGGGGGRNGTSGGNGGSGLIIIRYADTGYIRGSGGEVYYGSGYVWHLFKSVGTFTFST